MKGTLMFRIVKFTSLVSIFLLLSHKILAQEENLKVFQRWVEWTDGKNMLQHYLNDLAFSRLDIRDSEVSELKTSQDWSNYQKNVREKLMKIVGPFPEKTPLNPKVTGIVKKEGYRIEKIIFESMPGFYVTGCLFIPDGKGRKPAILDVIGHTPISFRAEMYQGLILHLVQKGFIVFAVDPIGQGERSQYWDKEKNQSVMDIGSTQHSYFGSQCLISGVSSGRYFVWDGIRAIDYLLTRKEVDPEKVGVTGISGGGTQTAYISAFDERVKASAPTCYITGFRRLLESIGAQDAEQNMFRIVKEGLTHADYIIARAPKPTMMVTTTRDFFSIQGARETFTEVSGAFRALGNESDLSMAEDDANHAFTTKNNTATVAFFQKYFNVPGNPEPGEIKFLSREELTVTPEGQLMPFVGGQNVFNINMKESQALMENIYESRKNKDSHSGKVLQKAKDLSGYTDQVSETGAVFRGRYQREGYAVEMYALQGNGNYVIPLLVFVPASGTRFSSIVYLNPQGKEADSGLAGQIEKLVKAGYLVAAPDVLGTGEVSPERPLYGEAGMSQLFFEGVLIGKSIPAIQAEAVGIVINFLKSRSDVNPDNIAGMSFGEMGPALLHAAAFNTSVKAIALINSPLSYRSLVMNQFYNRSFINCSVPGCLTAYDLPDLMASLVPRRLMLLDPRDHMNQTISIDAGGRPDGKNQDEIVNDLEFPANMYQSKGAGTNFIVNTRFDDIVKIAAWCFDK